MLAKKIDYYSFTRSEGILSKAQLEGFSSAAENFAKAIGESLSKALGKNVGFEVESIDFVLQDTFCHFASHDAYFVFKDRQSRATAFSLPDYVMFLLLKHFVPKEKAGDAYKEDDNGRYTTHYDGYNELERNTAEKIGKRFLTMPLNKALFKNTGRKFKFSRFEYDSEFLYAGRFDERGIDVVLNVIVDGREWPMEGRIWIPCHALAGKEDCYLSKDEKKEKINRRAEMKKKTNSNLDDMQVPLKAVLGEISMTIKELQAFDKDSIVEFDKDCGEDVELQANGITVARAEVVAIGNKYGVRITEVY